MISKPAKISERNDEKNLLQHIDLEVTKKCNLCCVHCSARSNTKGREMSVNEITTVLDQALHLGLKRVGFTGGEPLIRWRKLTALLRHSKNKLDLQTHLHTNGTLLRSHNIPLIAEFVDEISVSFLGIKPATHDRITGVQGSLAAAKNGLKILLKHGVNATAYIVPLKMNVSEIPSIVKEISGMGCRKFRILSLSPTGDARNVFEDWALTLSEKKWLSDNLLKTQTETDVSIDVGFCTRQDYPYLNRLKGHQFCEAAENRVHVDAFGEVFPCTASSGSRLFSAGNVREYNLDLSQIWRFSPLFQLFRYLHKNRAEKCKGCVSYARCMGGCRVSIHYSSGDITAVKSNCMSAALLL